VRSHAILAIGSCIIGTLAAISPPSYEQPRDPVDSEETRRRQRTSCLAMYTKACAMGSCYTQIGFLLAECQFWYCRGLRNSFLQPQNEGFGLTALVGGALPSLSLVGCA
jgi:hypothetical protein